jgi:hypothetical protein
MLQMYGVCRRAGGDRELAASGAIVHCFGLDLQKQASAIHHELRKYEFFDELLG